MCFFFKLVINFIYNIRFSYIFPFLGCCIKAYDTYDNSKIFFNICLASEIPAPVDITDEQLMEILISESPSLYKIPMSISNIRDINDRSGRPARAIDVAMNPKFYKDKICTSKNFRNFFITVIFEVTEEKFKFEINLKNWTILQNRTHMGGILTQMIENRDAIAATDGNKVIENYLGKNPYNSRKLIQEINGEVSNNINQKIETDLDSTDKSVNVINKISTVCSNDNASSLVAQANTRKPNYRLVKEEKDGTVQLVGAFHLPECVSYQQISNLILYILQFNFY